LFICTMMRGPARSYGLTGLGTAVKFIPRPVVVGFTNGIAILIASTQVKDFFGLHLDKVPGVFSMSGSAGQKLHPLGSSRGSAVLTVFLLILCRTLSPRIPGRLWL
jgi:SulP family sulfate permease